MDIIDRFRMMYTNDAVTIEDVEADLAAWKDFEMWNEDPDVWEGYDV